MSKTDQKLLKGLSINFLVATQISTVIMIRSGIVKAVLVFYREALICKAFLLLDAYRLKSAKTEP